jgi:hypothetical protein
VECHSRHYLRTRHHILRISGMPGQR